MDFIEKIEDVATQAEDRLDHIETEEATKNGLVMPFIQALGYDVFNPAEVIPEFTADFAEKKGEKVDYALFPDGEPRVLIEAKTVGSDLAIKHAEQLFRYFHMTDARIGVLTNGVHYRLFSDLEEENKMDERPFLEFNIFDFSEQEVDELKNLRKSTFDLGEMVDAAHDLKYRKALREYLEEQWDNPEEEFVRHMAKQVYDGRLTKKKRNEFQSIVRNALHQLVHDKVRGHLTSALEEEEQSIAEDLNGADENGETEAEELPEGVVYKDGDVMTTEEEMEGYRIVQAIMREVVDVDRVIDRDVKTYFGVLLDDNNRQPICRLHFNSSQKYLGLFDEEKNQTKVPIDSLEEIYDYREELQKTIEYYDE